MADKRRGGTDKRKDEKKKRKLNLPKGPRLVAEEEAYESNSPVRARASRPTVTVATAGASGQIPQAIPMRSGGQGTT